MDNGPLLSEEIEAGSWLVAEFDKFVPVKGAFWLRAKEEEERYLYLASDQLDAGNTRAAGAEVYRLAMQLDSPDLDFFRLRVIPGSDPLAVAACDERRGYPKNRPIRFGSRIFGGLSVADGYIYPATVCEAVREHAGVAP